MKDADNFPILSFETQQEWEAWLSERLADTPGLWLKMAKKGSGIRSLSHAGALESALCYGWIDGQAAALDGQYWLQKFTPRRPRSVWSRVNREKATALIAAGRMQPAGLRQVESAKADGRWEAAYDAQSTIAIPPDLQGELDRYPEAAAFFATLDSRNRYAILWRIQTAKRPETRSARIQKFVGMLRARQKIYPQ
jgi:uncharacterized protein YdeI (YjbR/CyaY-like superfamily)